MTDLLGARLTTCPLAHDADAARDTAATFQDLAPELRALLAGVSGCSPYLRGLMRSEETWLRTALEQPLDALVSNLIAEAQAAGLDRPDTVLRQAKRRLALMTALADLGGAWDVVQVTAALTQFADFAVQAALDAALLPLLANGKIPGMGAQDGTAGAGMVVFAMGKMGAHELNYSSDIDLICLFDEARYPDPADAMEARAGFIKATRKMVRILNDRTAEGYVFRTDLRLRPDASVTPVCMAMEAAERYYEGVGRTWERAAYIKARPCAGDIAAGEAFLARMRPFVWRRHLDFAAIEDAHDMRKRIRDHKGLHETEQAGADGLKGRDLKLAPGGIREIEFFTQTRQLIAGGRDETLRVRQTVSGLARLADAGWISQEQASQLAQDYAAHRDLEHRLQMIGDTHTHALPNSDDEFLRLVRMTGAEDVAAFRAQLRARIDRVQGIVESFYQPAPAAPLKGAARGPSGSQASGTSPKTGPTRELSTDPSTDSVAALIDGDIRARWRRYPALRSERAQRIFDRLLPDIEARLQDSPRPKEALAAFDGFLSGLPAGVQLFSMFEANPALLALLVEIAANAPALARYLSRNAGVLDAVIGGDFFADWPGREALEADLAAHMAQAADYEACLDVARRWQKEWHFRIGVHFLRGLADADRAGAQYAELAEVVVAALLPVVSGALAEKHGPAPGRGAVVLAMGSLGAGWLTPHSDLDLILIFDADGQEASEGRRPLAARAWYARLTQSLITALSAPTAAGRLYAVDMRLRPSGRQGPVATSLQSFRSYQRDDAWTWEHMALTRSRPIAGPQDLQADVAAVRSDVLSQPRDAAQVWRDVADMRDRIAAARGAFDPWDVKNGPGRMQDIELFAQGAALVAAGQGGQVPPVSVAGQLAMLSGAALEGTAVDGAALAESYGFLRAVRAALRLTSAQEAENHTPEAGAGRILARVAGAGDVSEVAARIARHAADASEQVVAALDGGRAPPMVSDQEPPTARGRRDEG